MKDAPKFPKNEEFVSGIELCQKSAVMKDAPAISRKEGYIGSMEQRKELLRFAAMKNLLRLHRKEEFVLDMRQSKRHRVCIRHGSMLNKK